MIASETTLETILKKNAPLMIKNICSEIRKTNKKIEDGTKKKMQLASTASGVRSSAHWKLVASHDVYIAELEKLYSELRVIHELTRFTELTHQDRYKFLDKYTDILEKVEWHLTW